MAQYIIQDAYTGYIWGDTRDIDGRSYNAVDIVDACRVLDESLGEFERRYEAVQRLSGDSGYIVYRVDINGSEAVAVVVDGQDRDTIAAVEDNCQLVGFVEFAYRETECA